MLRSSLLRLSALAFLLVGTAVAGPVAPSSSTSASLERRDINGVRDATAVPGTQLIVTGPGSTTNRPHQTTCFSDKGMNHCHAVDHHWFTEANDFFCRMANGRVFSMAHHNTSINMTWLYQPVSGVSLNGERGSIYMQIGFAPGADPKGPALTMTYSACWNRLMSGIVDACDKKGVNGKQGGIFSTANGAWVGNDQLFYINDPNSVRLSQEQLHPVHTHAMDSTGFGPPAGTLCGNQYWRPWDANTRGLMSPDGVMMDKCFSSWNGHSPDSGF